MSNYTKRPNENWVKEETQLQQKKRALKAKAEFGERNKGKKEAYRKDPNNPRCVIVTYE